MTRVSILSAVRDEEQFVSEMIASIQRDKDHVDDWEILLSTTARPIERRRSSASSRSWTPEFAW